MTGEILYKIYSENFAYRRPLPWKTLMKQERDLWAKIEKDMEEEIGGQMVGWDE